MIAELAIGTALLGAAVSGWIMAYRARGKANDEAERARLAEARTEAANRISDLAMANEAAVRAEFKASEAAFVMLKTQHARVVDEHRKLYERLKESNVPIGDLLTDDALDRLYAHQDRRETGGGSSTRADKGSGDSPVLSVVGAGAPNKAGEGSER